MVCAYGMQRSSLPHMMAIKRSVVGSGPIFTPVVRVCVCARACVCVCVCVCVCMCDLVCESVCKSAVW
jgi:hypothetical protein